MEVLHFVSHRVPGGAVAIADRLAAELSSPARVVSLGLEPGHSRGASARALARVVSVLIRERPRAVVSHMPRCAFLVGAVAVALRIPQRVVIQHASATQLSAPTVTLDAWFTAHGVFTDVVFVGDAVRETFYFSGTAKARRQVIHNGVDPLAKDLTDNQPQESSTAVSVVTVSALIPSKNLDLLIRACARSTAVTTLVIIGEGPRREALAQLADTVGLDLVLRGQILPSEVVPEVRRHTIFAFPSQAEALPLALIEAALAGMPIVASDIGPNREVVSSAALLRDAHDVDGWVEALDRLADDPDLRQRLGQAAARRGEAFGASKMLSEYEQVLRAQ